MFSFIDQEGTRTDNLTQDQAMRLYADAGFKGEIVTDNAVPSLRDWVTLPGDTDEADDVKPAQMLTGGDDCPECPDGRIIRGRSGLGCSGYRNGCTVHERIDKWGEYSGTVDPFEVVEKMEEEEPPMTADDTINLKVAELYRQETGFYPSWYLLVEGRAKATAAAAAAAAAAPAAVAIEVGKSYKPGEVDPEAAARVNEQRQYLEGLGFAVADTVYAPGSQVIGMGHENFNKHKRDLENMPTIAEECASKAEIIRAEKRSAYTACIKNLSFDGSNLIVDGRPLRLETNALKSWSTVRSGERADDGERVSISPALSYTRHSSAEEIGQMFEARKRRAEFVEKKTGRPQRLQLLTREVDGQERSVYAVVSPTYRYFGGDRFLENIWRNARQYGADLKGAVTYDQTTTRVSGEFWTMPPHIENLAAGDVFKVGLRFRTGDNGSTSHQVDAAYLRNLCLNLIILDRGLLNLLTRRHSGKAGSTEYRITQEIHEAMRKAFDFEQEFRARYGWMKEQTVAELFGTDDAEEIVTDVLTAQRPKAKLAPFSLMKNLPSEIKRDALVEALLLGVKETAAETGHGTILEPTMADIINVVTRAHDKVPVLASSGDSVAEHLARRAGEMIPAFQEALA